MYKIAAITKISAVDMDSVLQVWESAVRATHDFLAEDDIQSLIPVVQRGVREIANLILVHAESGELAGFLGVEGVKVEMLFIAAEYRGLGLGRTLLEYAVRVYGVNLIDVNEQNIQARSFYQHLGFVVYARSETDSMGNPFPLLHLKRKN